MFFLKRNLTMRSCILCGSSLVFLWWKKKQVSLMRCKRCLFAFIPKEFQQECSQSQYIFNKTSPVEYFGVTIPTDQKNFDRMLQIVESYCKKGAILDIGASVGTFLEVAQKRGWIGIGLEPNKIAVAECRKKGLRIMEDFFDEDFIQSFQQKNPERRFDVIHMGHVIDHVSNPLQFIQNATRLLREGGLIVVSTCSNFDSWLARRYQFKPEEHVVYFNKNSLKYAVEKSGFVVVSLGTQPHFRDLTKIQYGTTSLGLLEYSIIWLIKKFSWLGSILATLLAYFGRDTLFVIARKEA
jgi:2-polyprenyl-3-methyl-5-hydroxy-6-metoxy-1,4-benzoquinol methylase